MSRVSSTLQVFALFEDYYFFSYFLLKAEPINHTVIDFGSLIGLKSQKDFGSQGSLGSLELGKLR